MARAGPGSALFGFSGNHIGIDTDAAEQTLRDALAAFLRGRIPISLLGRNLLPTGGAPPHSALFTAMPEPNDHQTRASALNALLLLWLAGTALRLTILAVP